MKDSCALVAGLGGTAGLVWLGLPLWAALLAGMLMVGFLRRGDSDQG